jgi:hypothetical protein
MREIAPSSEDEMVAAFLRAEIAADRYSQRLLEIMARDDVDRRIVEMPDLADLRANAYRRRLLGDFRGYRQNRAIFNGFPDNLRWVRMGITRQELAAVRYIDYDYWLELSGGTRLAPDAAHRIRQGVTIFGVANDGFWELAAAWAAGVRFPELILVGTDDGAPLVLLEGHARLTAYFLRPDEVPTELEVIVGWSPDLPRWALY